ncbi:MAG: 6,7-dimethyl-8-ribityllumazine synthase [Candidatus Stahlbacteria bacterium]|nr:6,7-dimethyl-8-ribityllumazine synthase [Candidatus Stahlbacteria bacterium]
MKLYEGKISAAGKWFGIIVSRFNGAIADKLLDGAIDCLTRHSADTEKIDIFKVPGAFEVPQTLRQIVSPTHTQKYDGIICLSAIIRGETTHFELLSHTITREIENIAVESGIPVAYGVITADNLEQAIDRAGGKHGNKGFDAALSVMEQIGLRTIIYEKTDKGKRARS